VIVPQKESMEQQQDLNSEVDEFVPQDQEEAHVEVEQEQETPQEQPKGPSRESFKRLEQSKRELEQKMKLQEEMIGHLMKNQPQSQVSPPVQEVDEFDAIADDDFIPKGKVKALARKEATKIAAEIVKEEQQKFLKQQHQSTFMSRLKGQYSDFDQVVNNDTLALLEQHNPELAQTIADSKDPYKIGLQSYNYIKALGLHKENESPRAKEIEKKLNSQSKTIQSPQAFNKRPMAQAFNPEDDRKALFDEMNAAARKSGYQY
jgi:hypothetical protein